MILHMAKLTAITLHFQLMMLRQNVAFSTDYHNSDRPLSFRFRMEDGSAENVSTGFSDVLRDAPETGKSLTDDMVSFSDYDFKRLVSYYS